MVGWERVLRGVRQQECRGKVRSEIPEGKKSSMEKDGCVLRVRMFMHA